MGSQTNLFYHRSFDKRAFGESERLRPRPLVKGSSVTTPLVNAFVVKGPLVKAISGAH